MITTYDKRVIHEFQDWIADSYHDNLTGDNTPEQLLEIYLSIIGDIIAGSKVSLKEIVDCAYTGKQHQALGI